MKKLIEIWHRFISRNAMRTSIAFTLMFFLFSPSGRSQTFYYDRASFLADSLVTNTSSINFDSMPVGTVLNNQTLSGVTFGEPGSPTSALTVIAGSTGVRYPLSPSTGSNVLSPGGSDPSFEDDDLSLVFANPVSAAGIDVVFDVPDGASYVGVTFYDAATNIIAQNTFIPCPSGAPGYQFVGLVTSNALIKQIVFDEYDGSPLDDNVAYDSLIFSGNAAPSNPVSLSGLYSFTTIAGQIGLLGNVDGTNRGAAFRGPHGVAVDIFGNVYVPDQINQTIRKLTPAGTNWVATTIAGLAGSAGNADGQNSAARFNNPAGVAVDITGNVYVADQNNHTIRKLTPSGTNWVVTTIAGLAGSKGATNGLNTTARFNNPMGLVVDGAGNIFVADWGNNTIRKLTPSGSDWVVTTIAGQAGSLGFADGTNATARFSHPYSVAADTGGNVYVADWGNHTIRKLTSSGTNWVVKTIAGLAGAYGTADGTNSAAQFYYPDGVAVDGTGNVYVSDQFGHDVRKLTQTGGNWLVTTIGGQGGLSGSADGTNGVARFNSPTGVAVDGAGNVYVADTGNQTIRQGLPLVVVPVPPSITSQPQSATNVLGTTSTFAVGANGTSPLSYQWQKNGTNLSNAGNLTGATGPMLTLTNVLLTDAGNYQVIVTNLYGSATSSVAVLTVVPNTVSSNSVQIPATAEIQGAGSSGLPDSTGGVAPVQINLPAGAASLTVTNVTGLITMESGIGSNNADGVVVSGSYGLSLPNASFVSAYGGISGIKIPGAGALLGVFEAATAPANAAPSNLDFTVIGTNFTVLSPALNQTFYIGDGLTGNGSGIRQQFVIPAGATRLLLGIGDSAGWNGAPGFYSDNFGSFTASFQFSPAVPLSTNVSEYGNENLCNTGTYSSDPKAGATLAGLAPGMVTYASQSFNHGFPFSPSTNDYPGTDQIYVGSTQTGFHDGYSSYAGRLNGPQVISLNYAGLVSAGQTIATFTLGLAADDFQFPSFGNAFVAKINGVTNAALTAALNGLSQTGPYEQFLTVGIDPAILQTNGVLTLSIDEGGDGADGWAIDFLTVGVTYSNSSPAVATPPPPNLVAWWRAETNALDSVGTNNGTLQGGVTFTSGKVGQAFSLNGTSGMVVAPASASLNVGTLSGLTIEGWINPTTTAEQPIVEWNNGSNDGVHLWISVATPSGAGPGCLYANVVDTAGVDHSFASPAGLITTNIAQYVALTYDTNSGLAVLYFNGASVARQNLGVFTPQTSYSVYLGDRPGGPGPITHWGGLLDEISIYNRALSSNEVAAIYVAGSAGKISNRPYFLTAANLPNGAVGVVYSQTIAASVTAGNSFSLTGGSLPAGLNLSTNGLISGTPATAGTNTFTILATSSLGQTNSQTFTLIVFPSNVGGLQVTISPAAAISAGAQWQVDGGVFQTNGMVVTNLSVGNHALAFKTVPGWISPSNQTVTVSGNGTNLVAGNYTLVAPLQWTNGLGANGHYYEVLYSTGINWQDASNNAAALGGYLATITSAQENAFVFNLADNPIYWTIDGANNSEGPWLGGWQPPGSTEPSGGWQWIHGEGLFSYTSWNPGEPNNSGGVENSLLYFAIGSNNRSSNWNDGDGTSPSIHGYVVEWSSAVAVPPPSGLVAWWRAETNALDSVGTNNGTLVNGATFAPGKVGTAFSFSGSGDYVSVPSSPDVQLQNGLTLETWLYAQGTPANQAGIAGTWDDLAGGNRTYFLWVQGGSLEFLLSHGGGDIGRTTDPLPFPTNEWVHVVATFDGNIMRLYRNGVAVATTSYPGQIFTNGRPFFIGRTDSGSDGSDYWKGLIDEVSLYNRALSSNEVAAIYAAGSAGIATNKPYFITPTNLANGVVGVPYSQTIVATITTGNSFSQIGGSLPAGLNLSTNGLISGTPATAGTNSFTVRATSSLGQTNSQVFVLAVFAPPAISAQPPIETVTNGSPAFLAVGASGGLPLFYQWRRNGTNLTSGGNISGSTTSALSLGSATIADAANYSVVVTNAYGSVTSSVVALTVIPGTNQFNISLPLTTSSSNKLDLGFFSNGQTIQLSFVGNGDLVNSSIQTLPDGSLLAVAGSPFGFANPGSIYPTVAGGDGVNHYPGGGLAYDTNGSGFPFAGKATTDTTDPAGIRDGAVVGTFGSSPANTNWFYIGYGGTFTVPAGGAHLYVAVNDSVNSDNHGVYLGKFTATAPAFATTNLLLNAGAEAGSLTNWIRGGTSNPNFDNGAFDPGINPHAGGFDFYGGNGSYGSLSQLVSLIGNQGLTAAMIDNSNLAASVSFWEQGLNQGSPSDDASVSLAFFGATSNVLTTAAAPAIDSHNNTWSNYAAQFAIPSGTRFIQYTMNFYLNQGSDLDAFIDDNYLSVVQPASPAPASPVFSSQPQSLTVVSNQPAAFAVQVSGAAPLSFLWLKNGTAYPPGSGFNSINVTNVSLSLTVSSNAAPSDAGNYSIVITNAFGSVTSSVAVLTVTASGTSYTWNGGSGVWSAAGNWTPNGVPGANDTAFITSGTATVSTNTVVKNLDLNNGAIVNGTATLTISNVLNWASGARMVDGGRTVIAPGATANVDTTVIYAVLDNGRTLENAGTILWTGGNILYLQSGSVLTNRAGALMEMHNDATIMTGSGAAGRVDNVGTLRKTGSSGVTTVIGLPLNNYGAVDLRSGILSASSGFNFGSSAALNIAIGGTAPGTGFGQLLVGGTVGLAGTLNVTFTNGFVPAASNTFAIVGAGTRTGTFASFSYPSNNTIGMAANYNANNVTLSVSNLPTPATITWTNNLGGNWNSATNWSPNQVPGALDTAIATLGVVITMDSSSVVSNLTFGGTLGGTNLLAILGTMNCTGGGTLAAPLTILTNGTLNLYNSSIFLGGTLLNNGTMVWSNATLLGNGSAQINNVGLWLIQSDDYLYNYDSNSNKLILNSGVIRKSGGAGTTTIGWPVLNTGTIEVQRGTNLLNSSFIQTAGLTLLDGGNLSLSQTFQLVGGTLAGTNYVIGDVSNSGTVSPGASPGRLAIIGNYTQNSNGALQIELAGTSPGTNFDQLVVSGTASLAGALNVSFLNSFVPDLTNTFTFLTVGGRLAGNFNSFNYPSNVVGMQITNTTTSSSLIVTSTVTSSVLNSSSVLPPLQLSSPQLSGGSFSLSFPSVNGQSYTLLYNNDLATMNWLPFTNVTGTGGPLQLSVPATNTSRFFRISSP